MEVTGKVAIITGASEGIGLATAGLFAQHGAKIALAARSAEKLARIAEELLGLFGSDFDLGIGLSLLGVLLTCWRWSLLGRGWRRWLLGKAGAGQQQSKYEDGWKSAYADKAATGHFSTILGIWGMNKK